MDRANTTGDADHAGGLNTSSEDLDFYGSDHGDDHGGGSGTKGGKGKKGHGRRHSGESFEIGSGSLDQVDVSDLDPKDPKYRRRIQNRMASARFRAKAKERQQELDRLKSQVTQLRREKADLEAQCRNLNVMIESAAEQHRTSTMAWIVDHFWLRRKVHFKACQLGALDGARPVQKGDDGRGAQGQARGGGYRPRGGEVLHARGDEMNDDSDVSMDDAGYDKNRPEERLANARGDAGGGGRGLGERTAGAGAGPDGARRCRRTRVGSCGRRCKSWGVSGAASRRWTRTRAIRSTGLIPADERARDVRSSGASRHRVVEPTATYRSCHRSR